MHSTLSRLAIAGGMAAVLAVSSAPAATAATAPSATKYSTYAYIVDSRKASAVYISALVKQNSAAGIVRSPKRTVFLQRNLKGAWQNMLSRVTDSSGAFTVGFISVPDYQYRLLVTASATANTATSAPVTTTTPPPVVKFTSCAQLNAVYHHGVGKPGAVDKVRGSTAPVTTFLRDAALYAANTALDGDKDGIACEKA
jgi:hypothetical protein